MIHSIVSWDCCFRNFFHLIGSLAEQDYPKDQFELIFVEQWSLEKSESFNHQFQLLSLNETVKKFSQLMNVHAVFLGRNELPYHLGITNNAGIRLAKGKYISVMDGDLLVERDFLKKLENAHNENPGIINLDRRYALSPVGVAESEWMQAKVDFDLVLKKCKKQDRSVPYKVENKGPMISAPAAWWHDVGGYDEHRLWSTGVSRLGQDVTLRLEIFAGKESRALPGTFCVHPYHPMGFNRDAATEKMILHAQERIIQYTAKNKITKTNQRGPLVERYYRKYKFLVEANIQGKSNIFIRAFANSLDLYFRATQKLKTLIHFNLRTSNPGSKT